MLIIIFILEYNVVDRNFENVFEYNVSEKKNYEILMKSADRKEQTEKYRQKQQV